MKKYISRQTLSGETFYVAKNIILGSYLSTEMEPGKITTGIITELEVYIGGIDKASHSYLGKRTPRTECQFHQGGIAYIFTVYGIHNQFCIVTNQPNVSDVVLIRSIEPIEGVDIMMQRRAIENMNRLTVGPGNVCKALGISKEHYGLELNTNYIYLYEDKLSLSYRAQITADKRIGIDYAEEYAEKKWRYYCKNSKFVSKTKKL